MRPLKNEINTILYMNDIENTMHSILLAESEAIKNIPYSADYDRAVELIVEHVHRRHGKLVTSGMGKAGQIAMNIATSGLGLIPAAFIIFKK